VLSRVKIIDTVPRNQKFRIIVMQATRFLFSNRHEDLTPLMVSAVTIIIGLVNWDASI